MKTATTRVQHSGSRPRLFRRRYALEVWDGPDRGRALSTAKEHVTIGTAPQNDLSLSDVSVSRHHLRIEITPHGYLLTDLDSTNGTRVGPLLLRQAVVEDAVDLLLGETRLRLTPLEEEEEIPLHGDDHFGAAFGQSPAMRELFRKLHLASANDTTVLLEGETGTGKELVAEEIHRHSARREGPFVVVDCSAIPPSLIESELFGHVRGAFTGATADRAGAFEEAEGGTVFLDEVGELDLSLQPRLLRALEKREVKRLGESHHRRLNARLIAATHRDLQRCVNSGGFRADLFYRLAVVRLRVPPLRERPEDIELLVRHLLPEIVARLDAPEPPPFDPAAMQQLITHPWPGNVRELRNFLERMVTLAEGPESLSPSSIPSPAAVSVGHSTQPPVEEPEVMPFRQAKDACLIRFEREYLTDLLGRCCFNVAEASRRSGIDRVHLFRLIKKHGLRR